jgi:hypothetical protein
VRGLGNHLRALLMAETAEKLHGFREQLAGRFGVGGDALHAFVVRVSPRR